MGVTSSLDYWAPSNRVSLSASAVLREGTKAPKQFAIFFHHCYYCMQLSNPALLRIFFQIPEPYALLALIYQDGGKFEPALQFYKLACARDTRNWGNHQEAARIAEHLGDYTSRLEALRVLARLKPDNLNVAIDRARCLVRLQKPRQVGEEQGFWLWFDLGLECRCIA